MPWDAVKVLWLAGEKTNRELGELFGIVPNTIATRSKREDWHRLRKLMGQPIEPSLVAPGMVQKSESPSPKNERVMLSSIIKEANGASPALEDREIVRRANELTGSDRFRHRVIAANEKALIVLENNEPANVGEADRFAEALTKVERIGARTYGYDRETDRPVINIGFLAGSNEYTTE